MADLKNKAAGKKGPVQGKRKVTDEFQEEEIFQAPVIVREPTSRQCKLGSNVVLRITATGKPLPSYQWFHNGKKISGATSDRLTLNKVRRDAVGAYHCEAKNFVGKAASRQCMLSFFLNKVPKLVVEPREIKVEEGKPVVLKVLAKNPADFREFKVFWVFNGMRIKGAQGLELKISAGKKKYEGEYKAMISAGSSIESSNIVKVTILPPQEKSQENPQEKSESQPAVFTPPPLPAAPAANQADDWADLIFNPDDLPEEENEAPSSQLSPMEVIERSRSDIQPLENTEPSSSEEAGITLSETQKSLKLQELMAQQEKGEEAQMAEALSALESARRFTEKKEEPPAAEQRREGDVVNLRAKKGLNKKRAFLENMLARWQSRSKAA